MDETKHEMRVRLLKEVIMLREKTILELREELMEAHCYQDTLESLVADMHNELVQERMARGELAALAQKLLNEVDELESQLERWENGEVRI